MLSFGDKSIEVVELQEWLHEIGLYDGDETYYGVETSESVRKLQALLGIATTGEFDTQIRYMYELGGVKDLAPSNSGSENSGSQATFNDSYLLSKQEIPCYLVNLAINDGNDSGVVFFPHIPDEFTYSKGNVFEEQMTMGRSEPYQGYSGSTALTTTVVLKISADYAPNKDIDSVLTKLETFAYPRYGSTVKPPKCFFRCATFTLEGILTEISISRQLPIINGKYSQAEVTISLTETNARSVSASTVAEASYRAFR